MNKSNYLDFCGFDCLLVLDTYAHGSRLAIELVAADTERNTKQNVWPGDNIATATVNVPEAKLFPGETLIKDYSENEGMLDLLTKAGIVKPTGHTVQTGFVSVPVVTVDREAAKQFEVI